MNKTKEQIEENIKKSKQAVDALNDKTNMKKKIDKIIQDRKNDNTTTK